MEENSGNVDFAEQEHAPVEQTEQESVSSVEKEARDMGWRPETEWDGDPNRWVDAETFVRRGQEILPIVHANLKKERERSRKLEAKIAEIGAAQQEWMSFQKKQLEQQLEERITALKAARKDAVETGNGEQLNVIDDELHELRNVKTQHQTQQPQGVDPQFIEWSARPENKWYSEDPSAQGFANMIGKRLVEERGLSGMALYETVSEAMKRFYGPWQKQPRRTPVDSGRSSGVPARRKMTYESLPAERREAVDLLMRNGMIKSPDEYIAVYEKEIAEGKR